MPWRTLLQSSPLHTDSLAPTEATLTQQWPASRPESKSKLVNSCALPSLHMLSNGAEKKRKMTLIYFVFNYLQLECQISFAY